MRRKNNLWLVVFVFFTGCSVISYDRVFPKLTWAWTYEAKEQRRQDAKREKAERFAKEMQKRYGTNWVNEFPR